jgi:hypothetical protein
VRCCATGDDLADGVPNLYKSVTDCPLAAHLNWPGTPFALSLGGPHDGDRRSPKADKSHIRPIGASANTSGLWPLAQWTPPLNLRGVWRAQAALCAALVAAFMFDTGSVTALISHSERARRNPKEALRA